MLDKIWIGAVSYSNTKPLIYGLENSPLKNEIHLTLDYPSRLAERMQSGELDAALLPIAALLDLPKAHIFSTHCIASENKVASVCLFAQQPIETIKKIYLDYQSRTSAALIKVLCKHYWNKEVQFLEAHEGYINEIKDDTAGLIIGDRALEQLDNFEYVYDVVEVWRAMTNLPFVFATWVAQKPLSENFVQKFNEANALGFNHLPEIIKANALSYYSLETYYTENISYTLNDQKHKAIKLFHAYLKDMA